MADLAAALRQADRGDIPAMHRVRLAVRENWRSPLSRKSTTFPPSKSLAVAGWLAVQGHGGQWRSTVWASQPESPLTLRCCSNPWPN